MAYQLASVTVTTLLKAGLFTLLLLPDLRCVPLGLVGLLLAMMTLEMLRMAIDIATWGMGRAAFLAYRAAVVAGLVAGGFAVGAVIVREARVRRSDQRRRGTPRTPAGHPGATERFGIRLCRAAVSAVHRPDPGRQHYGRQRGAGRGGTRRVVTGLAAAVIGLYAATARRVADARKTQLPIRAAATARRQSALDRRQPRRSSATFATAACGASRAGAAPARWPGGNWSAPAVTGAAC